MGSDYKPPFEVTDDIINKTAKIAELVGMISSTTKLDKNPTLRRKNRIKTIHGSLAIEQNTLSLEQVTSVLNGKHIIAPPEDIAEVKNAFEIYDNLDKLNPYSEDDLLKAHSIMMRGLTDESGMFRTRSVGVVDSSSGQIIHFGTLPQYVPNAISELLTWLKDTSLHPVISSSIFHYEFEVIHPFIDGNGRIGRLWHTLILSKWNSLFAWLPVESIIHKKQEDYYKAINQSNSDGNSTVFVEFMLDAIEMALEEAVFETVGINVGTNVGINLEEEILTILKDNPTLSIRKASERLGISSRQAERLVAKLKADGRLTRLGSNKSGSWKVN